MKTFTTKTAGQTTLLAILLALLTAGCGVPYSKANSRDEFIAEMSSGKWHKRAETLTIERPYKEVLADVATYSDNCLDIKIALGDGIVKVHKTSIEAGNNAATIVMQVSWPKSKTKTPPGGRFVFIAKIRSTGTKTTEATIYYDPRMNFIIDPTKETMNGKQPASCPMFM
ncbi:MAG: hypothetical protein OEV59_01130 [Deltaproteobacteria bacterium]|nr:hypothetical protein [Deltaproteobacteria bacterium]